MSGPPEVRNDSLRFFQPDGNGRIMLPYCTGVPNGPDPNRPFYEENEKVLVDQDLQDLYRQQPAWFCPRKIWPQQAKTEISFEARTVSDIKAAYANVTRTPIIAEDEWGLHQKHIHQFLVTSNSEG